LARLVLVQGKCILINHAVTLTLSHGSPKLLLPKRYNTIDYCVTEGMSFIATRSSTCCHLLYNSDRCNSLCCYGGYWLL